MFYLNKILKFSLEGKSLQNVVLPYFSQTSFKGPKITKNDWHLSF